PVRTNFAFAVLEGDKQIPGDYLEINGYNQVTPERGTEDAGPWWSPYQVPNFFNSTVTKLGGGLVTNRVPDSENTLGFDTGIFRIDNPNNNVIENGDTSANISLGSTQDL